MGMGFDVFPLGNVPSPDSRGRGAPIYVIGEGLRISDGDTWANLSLGQGVFSVTDQGALGDGVTDDAAAIQAAIDLVEARGGGTVFLPAGTYLIGTTLQISLAKGLRFVGEGMTATTLKRATTLLGNMLAFVPGASGIWATFSDFKLEQRGDAITLASASTQTVGNGIYAYGALQSHFERIWFNKPAQNSLFLHRDGSGDGTGHHNRVRACLFDQGDQSANGDGRGLRLEGTDENFISACDFESNGRSGLSASSRNHLFDLSGLQLVEHCTFVTGYTGVKIQGAGTRVVGCIFDGNKDHCIRVNGDRASITANHLFNIGFSATANTVDGIWYDNVDDGVIVANTFVSHEDGGARSGVNISSGPGRTALIAANNFSIEGGAAWGTAAVVRTSATTCAIRDNVGYNPVGPLTPPAVPLTTVAQTNTFNLDCTVYVTGGTVTDIEIGGTSTGLTSGAFRVPAGQTIAWVGSGAPTWTWFAD